MDETGETRGGSESPQDLITVRLTGNKEPHRVIVVDPGDGEDDGLYRLGGTAWVYKVDKDTGHRKDSDIVIFCDWYDPKKLPSQLDVVKFAYIPGGKGGVVYFGIPPALSAKDFSTLSDELKNGQRLLDQFIKNEKRRFFDIPPPTDPGDTRQAMLLRAIRLRQRTMISNFMKAKDEKPIT